MNLRFRIGCLVILALACALVPGRALAQRDTVLTVAGDVERPYSMTMGEIASLPHVRVSAMGHDKREETFDGVLLTEFLKLAGMKFLPDVRGERVFTAVVVRAADRYHAAFSVAEIDTAFTDRRVVLADQKDGKPIGGSQGPLLLVVPGEKHHARWVRRVASLTVRKL